MSHPLLSNAEGFREVDLLKTMPGRVCVSFVASRKHDDIAGFEPDVAKRGMTRNGASSPPMKHGGFRVRHAYTGVIARLEKYELRDRDALGTKELHYVYHHAMHLLVQPRGNTTEVRMFLKASLCSKI